MKNELMLFAAANPARHRCVTAALQEVFTLEVVDNRWDADRALAQGPGILIVEDVLPGGRGLKICERARRDDQGGNRLILAIGDAASSNVEEAREIGVIDGWVPKDAPAGVLLAHFWAHYSKRDDARVAGSLTQAAPLLEAGRALFDEFEGATLTARTRTLLSEAAAQVVGFADACSAATLLDLLQGHHAYTFAHSLRVGILMATFGRHLGLPEAEVALMAETGLAHDVGKLRIPAAILAKPGPLTADETAVMRTHAPLGAAMLADLYPDRSTLIGAIRHHHEQLAGTGYPDGLKGAQIDELSLLTAVVDVYTALTDRRDYKAAMSMEQATAVMDGLAGPHLEPRLYQRFREVAGDLAAAGKAAAEAA